MKSFFILYLIIIPVGLQAADIESEAVNILGQIDDAINNRNTDLLGKYYAEDFSIKITRCGDPEVIQTKEELFKSMNEAYPYLDSYEKVRNEITTEVINKMPVIKSNVVEEMQLKSNGRWLMVKSREVYHFKNNDERLLVHRVEASQVCD